MQTFVKIGLLVIIISTKHISFLNCFKLDIADNGMEKRVATASRANNKEYAPEKFSNLKLKSEQLLGSRWTINKTVDVYHAIEIEDVNLLKKDELTLRIEFNLRQQWHAQGLQFPEGLFKENDPDEAYVVVGENIFAHMWSPDSYIATSRESNMNTVGTPLSLVYIFKNSSIIFKVRMFTKVACSSNFRWYPKDQQSCNLVIQSYKYHDDIVRYHWTDENLYRPIVIHIRRLFQYELILPLKYDNGTKTQGGRGKKYAYIRVKFKFERKLGNNFIQVYIPTILVVILSWFSFWLGLDAVPGRISLLVTCMLTMVTMHSGMKGTIPPVHYITMMDVWYISCMTFVFIATCEFVIVKYIYWRQHLKLRSDEKRLKEERRLRLYSIVRHHSEMYLNGWESRKGSFNTSVVDLSTVESVKQGTTTFSSSKRMKKRKVARAASEKFQHNEILQGIILNTIGDIFGTGIHGNIDNEANDKVINQKEKSVPITQLWVALDRLCIVVFPILFCLFNIIYWPVLFLGSESQENDLYGKLDK